MNKMKITTWKKFAAAILPATLLLTSCKDDDLIDKPSAYSSYLRFSVHETVSPDRTATRAVGRRMSDVEEMQQQGEGLGRPVYLHTSVQQGMQSSKTPLSGTRGTMHEEDNFWSSFSLFGYSYSGSFNDNCTPDFFYNLEVKKQDDGYYRPDNTYYLPGDPDTNITFFAMAPYSDSLHGSGNKDNCRPAQTDGGIPAFNYLVPWYSPNQQDLCFINGTEVAGGTKNGTVDINFHHALTAVRIVASSDMPKGIIQKVLIRRAPSTGIYKPSNGGNGESGSWEITDNNIPNNQIHHGYDADKSNNMDIEVGNGKDVIVCGDGGAYVLNGKQTDNTFFMLPQKSLPDNVVLEIVYKQDGKTATTLQASLAGQTWEMGTTVTYYISLAEDELKFNVVPENKAALGSIPWDGSDLAFNVLASKGEEEVDYIVEYSDNGTKWETVWEKSQNFYDLPPMLGKITRNNYSGKEDFNFSQSVVISETLSSYNTNSQTILASNRKSAEGSYYNLTNGYSSNCYIVDGWGDFQFLAVPGNSYYNNNPNEKVMDRYMNYEGTNITRSNMFLNPDKVEVLWQDVQGLIRNVHEYDDPSDKQKHHIRFSISKDNIAEGNAVIGALDSNGTVMWSWHIWVVTGLTDVNITAVNSGSYQLLSMPIGYVEGGSKSWHSRTAKIRFRIANATTTDEGVNTFTFDLSQKGDGRSVTTNGRAAMYQWGRKDPLLLLEDTSGDIATVFTNGYNAHVPLGQKIGSSSSPMKDMIRYPTRLNTLAGEANATVRSAGLWNAGISMDSYIAVGNSQVTKSIYDPSPKGYKIPARDTFGGLLSNNGANPNYNAGYSLTITYTKLFWVSDPSKRWHTYSNGSNTAIFPSCGVYSYDNGNFKSIFYSTNSFFWTAGKPNKSSIAGQTANILYIGSPISGYFYPLDIYGTNVADAQIFLDIRNCNLVIPVRDGNVPKS